MKIIRQLTIVTLVILATGCEFKPFEPTGYIERIRKAHMGKADDLALEFVLTTGKDHIKIFFAKFYQRRC